MAEHRIYSMSFASMYPLYVNKVERKGRTKDELDRVLEWLTGYDDALLADVLSDGRDIRAFFDLAPRLNPLREHVTGVVCGVRVEEIAEPLMREIRIMDKMVDELAKGKAMDKILRQPPS